MNTAIKITTTASLLKDENVLLIRKKNEIDTVKLEPLLTDILFELIQFQEQVISKEHLINKVWQGNVFVGSNALRKNIYKLRALIKEHHLEQEMAIETISKKGYKLTITKSNQTIFRSPKKWMLYAAASVILLLLALRVFTEDTFDYTKDQKIVVHEDIEEEEVIYK